MVLIRIFLLRRQRRKQKMRIFLKILIRIFLQQRQNHLHEHPLILCDPPNDGGGKVSCGGCLLPLSGAAAYYNCKQCKFILHKSCAELPNKIIYRMHPKHPLTLFTKNPYHTYTSTICDYCEETILGYDYHCSLCEYEICIQCVLQYQIVEHEGHEHSFKLRWPMSFTCDACGKLGSRISYICSTCHLWVHRSCASSAPPTIEHIGHAHTLILCDQRNDGGGKVPCDGCLLPLSGASCYNCMQCEFFLHKSCAELPNNIIHFLHPKHPLTLFITKTQQRGSRACDSCDDIIYGFSYWCSVCQFDLDIKCILLQQIVEHEVHEHSFKLLRRTSFTCDACGETSNDISCVCSTCLLLVHKSCASLPPTIKHVGHDHPLILIPSIQFNDPSESLCNVCSKDIETCFWCYCCGNCSYIAHLGCATSETKLGDERNELGSAFISVPNECTVDDEPEREEIERVTELQHISHQHSLTFSDDEPEREEICDGCVQTISGPFYNCAQCNYFLHVSCAELPDKIQHLLHPHRLDLFVTTGGLLEFLRCLACGQWCNGLWYVCMNCDFGIDLICASFSGTLRHEGHKHTLSLDQRASESECTACGSRCLTKFRCEECDFNLDLRCAALPSSVRHEWDKHPLKLTFSIIKDKLGTYYCDFCEERRDDPNHWFYYCEDCDVAVHPECLIGKHMRIKFGKSYKDDILHRDHLLNLVEKTRLPHYSGFHCYHDRDNGNTLYLECVDCNVHLCIDHKTVMVINE